MDQLFDTTAIDQIQLICTPTNASAIPEQWASILIKIDSQPLSRAALAHRVIGWVAHAERPLSIAEIWYAFSFGNNCDRIEEQKLLSVETLIEVCHGLVVLDDKDDVVKFLHPSACEFFRKMPGKFEQFQEDIARTCLGYLCLHDMQECFNYREFESVKSTLRQMPFLAYAAQYWGRHAQRVEQQLAAPIRKLLHDPVLRSSSFQALQHLKSEDVALDHESLPVGQAPLNIAAYWNLTLTANDILSAGGNSSSADSKGSTPLHWACRNGHASMVKLLLSYDAGLDIQDWRGWTPLFCAVSCSDAAGIVRPLLDKYADHLLVDIKGWTVLHWAVSTGKEETVRALLAYHRDFLAREKPVQILIKEVTFGQAREIVQYAGKKPASDGVLPIEIAAQGHDLVVFEVLLQDIARGHAESPERRYREEWTWPRQQLNEDLQSFNSIWSFKEFDRENWNYLSLPLGDVHKIEMHCGPGHYLMGPLLPEGLYSRALHIAIRDENMMMVRLLLELGADVNYNAVYTGRTPLHAATFRKDPEFARILLQNGANPTLTDHFGRTPLQQAIFNGFEKTATVLIEHGSDVNARTTTADMITPLMLACGIRYLDQDDDDRKTPLRIVRLLLARGASASLRDNEGRTALHLAVQNCEYDVVKELIAAGRDADVHAKDSSQLSVFHYLAKRDLLSARADEISDLLIHQYAEGIETTTNLNWQQDINDAVLLAIKNRCWEIVNILLQKTSKLPTGAVLEGLLAIKNRCCGIVNTLLQKTCKLPTGAVLEGLLSTAVRHCQPAAVQFLLEQGAVLNLDADKSILVSVMEWLWVEKIEALGQLLKILPILSTHVNATKCIGHHLGMTALLVAARQLDSAQAIQFLIDAGASIYQCDNYGQDAFLLAAIHGKPKALRCLLENKVKRPLAEHWLQVPDSQSLSSLPDENLEDLVCYSLLASDLLEIRTQMGKTPLQTAVDLRNTSMVRKLLAQGADLETRDTNGWTPLHNAVHSARGKDDTMIDILLEANADVSAATERWAHADDGRPEGLYEGNKWTGQALHLAAMFGRERLVKVLLERGADVHASTGSEAGIFAGHGPTALWIVLDTGKFYHRRVGEELDGPRLRIAEMLIERGAVVDGVANRLGLEDVLKFAGFEELWEKLRVGIWEQKGQTCQTFLYRKRRTED